MQHLLYFMFRPSTVVSKRNGLENIALHVLLNMIYIVPDSSVFRHSPLNYSNEEEDLLHKTTSL